MSPIATKTRAGKKFQALLAIGLTEQQAAKMLEPQTPEPTATDKLIAAGFTADEAAKILAPQPQPKPEATPQPASSKQLGEQLVADKGFTFTRGRVYVNPRTIEAAVRVAKTGAPEIVNSAGGTADTEHHVTAVLAYRTDGGDVALQNLH